MTTPSAMSLDERIEKWKASYHIKEHDDVESILEAQANELIDALLAERDALLKVICPTPPKEAGCE